MTNIQRMRSDLATIDKREIADKATRDDRIKNDELTTNRRSKADRKETADKTTVNSRIKNDELTGERRYNADKVLDGNRARNDELTANRREVVDDNIREQRMTNLNLVLVISLLVLTVFTFGTFFIF